MSDQTMDPDWLKFHPNPKQPEFVLPAGAVDAHCHVFGPSPRFPFAPERKYTPCNAGKEKLYELRDYLGFTRNVIVQATCHGKDNSAMVDACRTAGDLARGIASVGSDVSRDELVEMLGEGQMTEKEANEVIMAARAHWFAEEDAAAEAAAATEEETPEKQAQA